VRYTLAFALQLRKKQGKTSVRVVENCPDIPVAVVQYNKVVLDYKFLLFVCFWHDSPQWARVSSSTRLLYYTQRRTTVSRTPLDEWSARCKDLYLTTHNTHSRHTSMPPRDSNPQSQQAIGRRPTPLTARPLGLAQIYMLVLIVCIWHWIREKNTNRCEFGIHARGRVKTFILHTNLVWREDNTWQT
jgi:hypothetical protein